MSFEVTYLTLEEQKCEILFKKKSVKFKNMLFKCEKCGIGFVSHEAYKDHNLRHDNVSKLNEVIFIVLYRVGCHSDSIQHAISARIFKITYF